MHAFRRTLTQLAAVAALAITPIAHAQGTAAAPVAIDAEKQKLIDHLLSIWHPEGNMVQLARRPALQVMDRTREVVQQAKLPSDKADKTIKDVAVDVQKYVDTATTIALNSSKKDIPLTIVPTLAQNFTSEELKQLIATLESPVNMKFQKLAPQMEQSLAEKVTTDAGPDIKKNIDIMSAAVSAKLRDATSTAAPAK